MRDGQLVREEAISTTQVTDGEAKIRAVGRNVNEVEWPAQGNWY